VEHGGRGRRRGGGRTISGTRRRAAFASVAYLPSSAPPAASPTDRRLGSEVGLSVVPDQFPWLSRSATAWSASIFAPDPLLALSSSRHLTLSAGVHVRRHAGRWALSENCRHQDRLAEVGDILRQCFATRGQIVDESLEPGYARWCSADRARDLTFSTRSRCAESFVIRLP